jgi:hypothetical protein
MSAKPLNRLPLHQSAIRRKRKRFWQGWILIVKAATLKQGRKDNRSLLYGYLTFFRVTGITPPEATGSLELYEMKHMYHIGWVWL